MPFLAQRKLTPYQGLLQAIWKLGNLTRFLTYHEHHGDRAMARELYRRSRPKPATGPAPTWKPPAPIAPTGSTSLSSCAGWKRT